MNAEDTTNQCSGCGQHLDNMLDRQISTGKYWKNCQRCRDKRNSSNRRKRGLPPIQREQKRVDHGAKRTSQETGFMTANSRPQEPVPPVTPAPISRPETSVAPARAPETSLYARAEVRRRAERESRLRAGRQASFRRLGRSGTITAVKIVRRPPANVLPPRRGFLAKPTNGDMATNPKPAYPMATDQTWNSHSPIEATFTRAVPINPTPPNSSYIGHIPIGPIPPTPTAEGQASTSSSRLECSVCSDLLSPENFPRLEACSHEPQVCRECFLEWLDQRMASTTWEQIQCPSSGCNNSVSHDDVRKYAPAETFTRFDELSMRSLLSDDPAFFYCPAQGCSSGQIHDTTYEGNIFRCIACGFRVCTHHDPHVPFHENETCAQFDERIARERAEREEQERKRRAEEAASLAVVEQSSVECPGCGAHITKTSGCDHMSCRRRGCNFEFCYVCRAPYRGARGINAIGNNAHADGCRYSPRRLPAHPGLMLDLI